MSASEPERLHTSVLVAPAAERRRLRKQRRQAAARLQADWQAHPLQAELEVPSAAALPAWLAARLEETADRKSVV